MLVLHGLYLVGDRTWWGEFVAVWPPIGWLAILGPAVWRFRDRVGGALVVVLVAVHGEWPRLGSVPGPAGLRVVSWNVAGQPSTWSALRELDADLLLLQEHAGPPPGAWPGYAWRSGLDAAVLSRFPLAELPTRKVGPWTEPLVVAATTPAGKIVVINVRLVLPSVVTWVASGFEGNPRVGHEARVAQFEALARLVDESSRRAGTGLVLLCGDFNSPVLPSFAPLRERLVDAWKAAGRGWPGTATANVPLARIDQCWASPGLQAVSARSIRRPVSDHRLLLVDYALPALR